MGNHSGFQTASREEPEATTYSASKDPPDREIWGEHGKDLPFRENAINKIFWHPYKHLGLAVFRGGSTHVAVPYFLKLFHKAPDSKEGRTAVAPPLESCS